MVTLATHHLLIAWTECSLTELLSETLFVNRFRTEPLLSKRSRNLWGKEVEPRSLSRFSVSVPSKSPSRCLGVPTDFIWLNMQWKTLMVRCKNTRLQVFAESQCLCGLPPPYCSARGAPAGLRLARERWRAQFRQTAVHGWCSAWFQAKIIIFALFQHIDITILKCWYGIDCWRMLIVIVYTGWLQQLPGPVVCLIDWPNPSRQGLGGSQVIKTELGLICLNNR